MGMVMIKRMKGIHKGRNKSSAYKDLVWTVATSSNTALDFEGQTRLTLATIEKNLLELGSNKQHIVTAQVFITDMNNKRKMDVIWQTWLGDNPEHWPQRACLGVALEGNTLIEVTVTAVLKG
jgi:enamine deaminase RidA (YjgF/YER057c/UK114 family)